MSWLAFGGGLLVGSCVTYGLCADVLADMKGRIAGASTMGYLQGYREGWQSAEAGWDRPGDEGALLLDGIAEGYERARMAEWDGGVHTQRGG